MQKYSRNLAVLAASMLAVSAASAAVPEAVTTQLSTLQADVTTIAGVTFGVFLVIVAFRYFRRSAN